MSDNENTLHEANETPTTEEKSVLNETVANTTAATTANIEEAKLAVEEKEEPRAKEALKAVEKPVEAEKSDTEKAVEAVEKQVAEKSESDAITIPEVPTETYEKLEFDAIIQTTSKLIEDYPIQSINKHVETLKKVFNSKMLTLSNAAKKEFLAIEGNAEIDFRYDNPLRKEYNNVLFDYKKKRNAYYKELEAKHEENLVSKQALIERLKKLIDEGDAKTMYNDFQEIQKSWRSLGPVSREHYRDLWRTYHFHVDRFYDLLHLRNDLRDLDFKHNYEEKIKLVEKAEALAASDDINKSFDELQVLHRLWKEEIGPVSRTHREEIWERFSNATKLIHDKRQAFYEKQQAIYEENLAVKEAIIAEIAKYDISGNKTHRDWQKSMNDIQAFRDLFFKIGKVPRDKNKMIWNKFKEATSTFNQAKNDFYKNIKSEQNENLEKKMRLIEIAESLKESTDFAKDTDTMKRIQSEWKTIGHVPRKVSDKIWNRFKEACNLYFDNLHKKDDEVNAEQFAIYQKKKAYLSDLKSEAKNEGYAPDINDLKTYIKDWKEIGSVPRAQRYIDSKFNKFLDPYFEKLSTDRKEGGMLRYQSLIEGFVEQNDFRKISGEIQFVRNKIDNITKEKQQLENNMLFFSNTDDSNPMFKNIRKTLSKLDADLDMFKAKLEYLRTVEV